MSFWKGTASAKPLTNAWVTWEIEGIPANCLLSEFVLLVTAIDNDATSVTVYVSHDDDGKVGVTPFVTSSATQLINIRDADSDEGFVAFSLAGVWFSHRGENPRVHCRLNTGNATGIPLLYAHRGVLT